MPYELLQDFLRKEQGKTVGIIRQEIVEFVCNLGYATSYGEYVADCFMSDVTTYRQSGRYPSAFNAFTHLHVEY